ncbi:hypothetical protein SAMN04244581_00331 [Paracoccus denitrificans]|jgi:hypothetical protein|nr:hypothetical protein PDE01_18630 [Paracoccus denitrificans]SDH94830.1 hypothetical protein SAMN04244581_00331 [Paracoccus denitrificans]SFQ96324.1 hypothetical protein SAMN04244569_00420 [Paracoccus denitrificans]
MLVNGKATHATGMHYPHGDNGSLTFLQVSGIGVGGQGFSGSVADWCEQGFSICESYLIEAQNLFVEGDPSGFLAMAEAQFDAELVDEVLLHANALLKGVAFCRLAGRLQLAETGDAPLGLNWTAIANLWCAMETTKGDMRMPRLAPEFERRMRGAMRLS